MNPSQSTYCREYRGQLSDILESGELSDCNFLVGPESDQQLIPSYKLILATASPVFKAMFYGSLAEKNDPITMPDVLPAHFKVFLNYIYTSEINLTSLEEASGVYYCAKKFLLPHLQQLCSELFLLKVDFSNACQVYEEYAQLFEENEILDKANEIMTNATSLVLNDPSFLEIKFSTLLHIFSLDKLSIDSEVDLLEAAVRYYKARGKVNIITSARGKLSTQNEADDKMELSIQSVIDKVRFLTITPKQFVECQARELLMSEAEDRSVLHNILSTNTNVPYPSRLCPNRELRVQKNMSKTFSLKIQDFKNLNCEFYSTHQYLCGFSWRISVRPYESLMTRKCPAVSLYCYTNTKSSNWNCIVWNEMIILSSYWHRYKAENKIMFSENGGETFHLNNYLNHKCTWWTVLDPSNGLMKDGAITIEATVKVLEYSFN